jgi:hypothetical protein
MMRSISKSDPARAQEIETVRAYARDRAEQTSVRAVAKETGLGPSTVHNFLHGVVPHPRVRRALVHWYWTRMGGDAVIIAVQAALAELCGRVPAPLQLRTRYGLLDVIEGAYVESGLEPPGWLAEVRDDG